MDAQLRTRLYRHYSTHHAGRVTHAASRANRANRYSRITRHLPSRRDARIVDLGCGQGRLLQALKAMGYTSCEGVDVSEEQVALAHAAGLGRVRLGDFREALAEGGLDAVLAIDFLEHLSKPEVVEALELVRGALVEGGVLIVQVPNGSSPYCGHYRFGDFTHELAFTARSVRQIAALTGFSSVSVYPCEATPDTIKGAVAFAASKLSSTLLKAPLIAQTGVVRGHVVTLNLLAVLRT